MAEINVLDKIVYNRIAAGEVVERPFSVVKELLENSIDAGADEIEINIVNGGKDCVKISDNGSGIDKTEIKKAFLAHATSKIKNPEDLDRIMTLGFRGEALASIGAVAKVKIVTKTESEEIGSSITCEGGVIGEAQEAPSMRGTTVTVDNLFYNTPARQKFLKAAKSEETDITNIISRLILANPDIAFKYSADGKLILQSYGGGLEEALVAVYGFKTVNDCFLIETEKNGLKISGYIGKHYFTKPNRTYETLILNGRYIQNVTVQSAIQNAYGSYLMKRQYPFYVLNINISPDFVDVNVHPNKTEVRFQDNQVVYGSVYSVISKVLDGSSQALEIIKSSVSPVSTMKNGVSDKKTDTPFPEITEKPAEIKIGSEEKKANLNNAGNYFGSEKPYPKDSFALNRKLQLNDVAEELPVKNTSAEDIFAENKRYIEEMEKKAEEKRSSEQEKIDIDASIRVVGQVLTTYLILEKGTDLYFIDQHAAHERLLYDKFYAAYVNKQISVQPLLLPYVFTVNESETEFLISKFDYLRGIGIEIDEFGNNTFQVSSVPLDLIDLDLKAFFDDLLSDMSLRKTDVPDIINSGLMQKACKSAIKSGNVLSEEEINKLLKAINNNFGLKCPHGRPIAVKITRTEIDKWFKRIL